MTCVTHYLHDNIIVQVVELKHTSGPPDSVQVISE